MAIYDRINKTKFVLIRQIFGFGFAGVMGFAVEYILISGGLALGLGAITPRVVSLPLAILVTFLINRFFSFAHYAPISLKEVMSYYLGMLGGAAASFLIYTICILSQFSALVSLVIATCIAAGMNFFFSRYLFLKP